MNELRRQRADLVAGVATLRRKLPAVKAKHGNSERVRALQRALAALDLVVEAIDVLLPADRLH